MIGSPRGDAEAVLAALPVAEATSARSATTVGSSPVASVNGAAVWWVRRSGVDEQAVDLLVAAAGAPPPGPACGRARQRGSPWPVDEREACALIAAADAPWRTRMTSVAAVGSSNGFLGNASRWLTRTAAGRYEDLDRAVLLELHTNASRCRRAPRDG